MMELKVLTGVSEDDYLIVKFSDGRKLGAYGWTTQRYKVKYTKKGAYVTVNKKRHYLEDIPKGEWRLPKGYTWGQHYWYPEDEPVHEETKRYMEKYQESVCGG